MSISEWLLSSIIAACAAISIYYIFKTRTELDNTFGEDVFSLEHLCAEMKKAINDIVNMDIDALNLNRKDLESRKTLKRSLSDAIRKCSQGNINEKMIVIARMKSTLFGIGIREEVIDKTIPFIEPDRLTAVDMFEILLYLQKKDENHNMFRTICEQTKLDNLKKDEDGYYYSITEKDIKDAYYALYSPLSYDDKLNILTQRIYEETYGLSVTDLLIMEDASIDGISGGTSGGTDDNVSYREEDFFYGDIKNEKTHESIWIIFAGKHIHLEFLSFRSSDVLIRICKNLSEHGQTGHVTSAEGGLKTHLADGSRVTIFRPNNATQWAFYVRKHTNTYASELKDLITDKGNEYPIQVINWATKGCLNIVFSGDQNSGKTTNVRAAVREIDRRQPIRTIEADFELYLNDEYGGKNILGARPSERMGFPKLIELLKASDAHTILFGETASLEHARHLIDLLLAGTKRIITTGHWPTSDEMISYFVHSMGGYGTAGTEQVEALVARLLHLDIHCVRENDGHRHIDRITEIIPYEKEDKEIGGGAGLEGKLDMIAQLLSRLTRKNTYYTQDIVIYKDGEYKMINPISDRLADMLLSNLPPEERAAFLRFNAVLEGGMTFG